MTFARFSEIQARNNAPEEILAEWEEGRKCANCGKENDFYDDCGWFYGYAATHYAPHCQECWNLKGYKTGER
jgi:membrane protease subunit (stomatin/prohibitin family)